MHLCPQCQTPQEENSDYCKTCGYHLSTSNSLTSPTREFLFSSAGDELAGACSACGHKNFPGVTFCERCGVQLAPVESVPPPAPRLIIAGQEANYPDFLARSVTEKTTNPVDYGELLILDTNTRIHLPEGRVEIIIGRTDPEQNIFPDVDMTPFGGEAAGVSRQHARITFQEGKIYLEDLSSTNFTYLNNLKLEPAGRFLLKSGDELGFGKMRVRFFWPT